MKRLLALDLGESTCRAIVGEIDEKLKITELCKFENGPVVLHGTMYWDILDIYQKILESLSICNVKFDGRLDGIGIDNWDGDFGLLDREGELLCNPVHYRDKRTLGIVEKVCEIIPAREIYEITGLSISRFWCLYHLYSMVLNKSPILETSKRFLMTNDLLNYFISGKTASDPTVASTTQMYDVRSGEWSHYLLEKLGIPTDILPDFIKPCTVIGNLTATVKAQTGLKITPLVNPASLDTTCAIEAVPAEGENWAYISCGTWAIIGTQVSEPIINDESYRWGFNNGAGVGGVRFSKDTLGMWVIQNCKREWANAGVNLTFDEIAKLAQKTKPPPKAFIDPTNEEIFDLPGKTIEKIISYCRQTGQSPPKSIGEIARCVYEGLALRFRNFIEQLEKIIAKHVRTIYLLGGGSRDELLCQFTANATGKKIVAGPAEATSIGNILLQALALGEISSLRKAREIVRNSFKLRIYQPEETGKWEEAYARFLQVLTRWDSRKSSCM